MTDPLKNLHSAFSSATPAPDPARKAVTLARAQEIFDRAQESAKPVRPIPDRRHKWAVLITGVGPMLKSLTTRPALTATTALVAVGLVALLPVLREGPPSQSGPVTTETDPRPVTTRDAPPSDQVTTEAEVRTDSATPPPSDKVATETDADTATFRDDAAPGRAEPVTAPESLAEEAAPLGAVAQSSATPTPEPMIAANEAAPAIGSAQGGAQSLDQQSFAPPSPAPELFAQPSPAARMRDNVSSDAYSGLIAPAPDLPRLQQPDTEAFANAAANPVIVTTEAPVSTFSVDVDTASYAVVRASLMAGQLPPREAVRIEEMVNYFPYAYPGPDADEAPFKPTVTVTGTPWNANTQLLHIALQGRMPAIEARPALNLVFLIDTSGSMNAPDKLPLLKQSFRLMLGQLRPKDQIAIVTYAGSAGRVLDPTPASERATILAALDRLDAGGATAGQAGLQQAYATASAMAADGEVTRVILATDGDFNVGIYDPDELKTYIADQRDSGTYLSVLGFGRGNLDDATMQALAQNGNGQAAYIDTLNEAQKVLVDQLTGALFPIANDVKIQVEFNPATIAEYRLIGYETRALRREDFNNDRIDAGEIGAGHSVTALYEITPVGSPAILNDPLRFAPQEATIGASDELAFLRLRYKAPGEDTSQLIEVAIAPDMGKANADTGFAAAIAGFGQLLTAGSYTGSWSYADAIALAESNLGTDPFGYRHEAVTLMRLAASLSQ